MNTLILLLGSNLGDSIKILRAATNNIKTQIGQIKSCSSIFVSEPWGFQHENHFYNMALSCETVLSASKTIEKLLLIERQMGRIRSENKNYTARIIDIDIMFFNRDIIMTKDLQVPHPRLPERRFALTPLNEIIPDYIHPEKKITIRELLEICNDKSEVKKLSCIL